MNHLKTVYLRRRSAAFVAVGAAACLAGAGAGTAHAATPLACIGTGGATPAVDNIAPVGMDVTFAGDLPDAAVGQRFSIRPTVNYNLSNAYLKQLGLAGALDEGDNNLNAVTFWVKVRGTNTVEQQQVLRAVVNPTFGRYNGTTQLGDRTKTSTRIHWNGATQTATVRYYDRDSASTTPQRIEQQIAGTAQLDTTGVAWTPSSSAPIEFSVAPAGSFGALPVGAQWRRASSTAAAPTLANPANLTASPATNVPDADPLTTAYPYGSVYARLAVGNATDAGTAGADWDDLSHVSLDCVTGDVEVTNSTIAYSDVGKRAQDVAPAGDSGRYTVLASVAVPFVRVTPAAVAKPMTCIDHLGRYISREVNPYQMVFRAPDPGTFKPGSPYTLGGVKLDVTLDPAVIKGLYDNLLSYQVLPSEQRLGKSLKMWIALEGRGTTEGVQIVRVDGSWTATFQDPDGQPGSGDEIFPETPLTFDVPASTWTPAGNGPISVGLAQPGTIPVVSGLVGFGHEGAAGAVYDAFPYGSLYIRAETGRYGETLDCSRGAVDISNPSVAFSNLGRKTPSPQIPTPVAAGAPQPTTTVAAGSGGRYTITPKPFEAITVVPAAAAPPVIPAPPVTPAPAPTPAPVRSTITSTALKVTKAGKVAVSVACPAAAKVACTGTAQLRSVAPVALRKGAKKAIVTVAGKVRYSVAPGKAKALSLGLSQAGKTTLKGRRSLKVKIVLTPAGGKLTTKTVTLGAS
ncbi:hypothetical protein DSM112329_00322 [Paraconexibacter sp. AEG42_29]|uniref:Uncharacterized protein n=1 Tax=Paraconexibacter sp. AEG42_29 TaxID=2997339 RepID=A0AAU7APT9_9ACTN